MNRNMESANNHPSPSSAMKIPSLSVILLGINLLLMMLATVMTHQGYALLILFVYSWVGGYWASRIINKANGKEQPAFATVLNALGYALLIVFIGEAYHDCLSRRFDPLFQQLGGSALSMRSPLDVGLELLTAVSAVYGVYLTFLWKKEGLIVACVAFALMIVHYPQNIDDYGGGNYWYADELVIAASLITPVIAVICWLNLKISDSWSQMTWRLGFRSQRYFYISWIVVWLLYVAVMYIADSSAFRGRWIP